MAKSSKLKNFVNFIAWLTSILVSLSVGFALINGTLSLPVWLGGAIGVPIATGWIVVFITLLGVVLEVVHRNR